MDVVAWPWLGARCPPKPLYHSPSSTGQGRKYNKRLVGRDKGNLIKRKQRKTDDVILYFPSAGNVWPLPGKQGFSTRSGCSGRRKCPPFHLPLLSFYNWADIIWYRISVWLVWVSCPGYVPSQDLTQPQPAIEGGQKCWRDSLDAVPALLSSSQNTGVLSTPF